MFDYPAMIWFFFVGLVVSAILITIPVYLFVQNMKSYFDFCRFFMFVNSQNPDTDKVLWKLRKQVAILKEFLPFNPSFTRYSVGDYTWALGGRVWYFKGKIIDKR